LRMPRITTRRIMVAVALVAVALSTARAVRRCRYCLYWAGYYAQCRNYSMSNCFGPPLSDEKRRAINEGVRAECGRMEAIYLRAAWHPWESVPPCPLDDDPPPP
jgi:hypothetical protein